LTFRVYGAYEARAVADLCRADADVVDEQAALVDAAVTDVLGTAVRLQGVLSDVGAAHNFP
jgi:hypothetical protein